MRLGRDEWDERDPRLDRWAAPRDRELERRLGLLGYLPKSGYHADGCTIGLWAGAPCTCREAVARRETRRRATRRERAVLTR